MDFPHICVPSDEENAEGTFLVCEYIQAKEEGSGFGLVRGEYGECYWGVIPKDVPVAIVLSDALSHASFAHDSFHVAVPVANVPPNTNSCASDSNEVHPDV
uniref:Uncharacterized protein n=1 Tax=viral metagenome TaxID=1070528 RepID=A0A6C0BDX7_9ZZZZ